MKLKKYIAIGCCLTFSVGILKSQSVTIERSSGTVLLVDPLQNTVGASGTSDDVVVLANGRVGINTPTPATRIDINGTLRIADGTQSDGAFLLSDVNGVGTWFDSDFIGRRVVWGSVMTSKNITPTYQDITSTPLELTGGLWMIVAKATMEGDISGAGLTTAEYVWLKIVQQVTDTGGAITYNDLSEGGLPYSIRASMYPKYYSTPMIQGFISVPIEGVIHKTYKYFVYAKSPSVDFLNPKLSSDLSPAYFYAIKLQ